jgi:hypothetical protein
MPRSSGILRPLPGGGIEIAAAQAQQSPLPAAGPATDGLGREHLRERLKKPCLRIGASDADHAG